ncbi:IS66 family transposase [Paracoccus denitrificans]|uniref:IS66 family transposase n=1 Tax=Paracoccus denitrificans TaxID=266 RepID=UPI0039BF68BF
MPAQLRVIVTVRPKYIHRHWDGLQTFLRDGRVEIDSNSVENLIRPIASGESLCPSSSSIWKHLKLVSANGVTRAPFLQRRHHIIVAARTLCSG